ncbi:peptide antibiotic transporter SbmA [Rhizobium sp. FKL33]|uniref:peptide antibiotic transporter SbmA n=1 Tax=Rhizobium sp. FKL33 TaxID=2562307 RepID=UPI0010C07972|nr:peptide antibiotic transporter SbmA [Rhizobium sp. FKL33]
MFHSFFPAPKKFFGSLVIWTLVCVAIWFGFANNIATSIGLPLSPPNSEPVIGVGYFFTNDAIVFYGYFILSIVLFCGFWQIVDKNNPWRFWSIWVSSLIVFMVYFVVDLNVALTYWRGPQYNLIVQALTKPNVSTVSETTLYASTLIFFHLATIYVVVVVFNNFVTSHYLFRWRNAMNDYYYANWDRVRNIEGASQRIQEDTMRFSRTVESLGTSLIDAFMTMIAYLPLLNALSTPVKALPVLGEIPYPLVTAALAWAVFGTLLMVITGIKLPGLEFQNQRVEAAFRKELVYGEDDPLRAKPATVTELFSNIRRNNFRMFWHYGYFNFVRFFYIQTDAVFPVLILVPSISAAVITYGLFEQLRTAFAQVTNSLQYLVNSWPTMVELISIQKRLAAFEAAMNDEPLPSLDQKFIESGGEEKV